MTVRGAARPVSLSFVGAHLRAFAAKMRRFHSRNPPLFKFPAGFMFSCGCSACLLFQELNHIKAVQMGLAPGPQGLAGIPQQKMMM